MAFRRIGSRRFVRLHPMRDMAPVVGINLGRVDTKTLDRIDMAQNLFDLGPAFDLQQNLATGAYERQRLIGVASRDRAQNVP